MGSPSAALRTVDVTGTNGKTSTAYLTESILQQAEVTTGLIGTVEIRYADEKLRAVNTTPESLDLQRTLREMRTRSIDTVVIDGRIVIKDRVCQTIDEDALRREVIDLMRSFIVDFDDVLKSRETAMPHMLNMHRRVWSTDVGLNRFIARTR